MAASWHRFLFLAAVGITLVLPLTVMTLGENQTVSRKEKRLLTVAPEFTLDLEGLNSFPSRFETWFNDHFGLRDELIQLYSGMYVWLAHASPQKENVLVGKNGWLFLSTSFVVEDFVETTVFPRERLARYKMVLLDREKWLEKRGIRYVLVIPPNKMTVYPEYMPDRLRKLQKRDSFAQLTEYLDKKPRFASRVDLLEPLLAEKHDARLYFKTDTHWNSRGGFVAYRAIMERLQSYFPELHPIEYGQLEVKKAGRIGDLMTLLNLPDSFAEKVSIFSYPESPTQKEYSRRKFPAGSPAGGQRYGELSEYEQPGKKRTAMFIRDSFGAAIQGFLVTHFGKTSVIREARFEDVTQMIDTIRPDVVIDLSVARLMDIALQDSPEVRREIMADDFRKKSESGSLLVDIKQASLPAQLQGVSQLSVVPGCPGCLQATGQDPQYRFALPERISKGVLNVYCCIESDRDDLLKLYFSPPGTVGYAEGNSEKVALKKGKNEIYLRLFAPVAINSLRLDPGERAGTKFRLMRFSLFEQPMDD